MQRMRRIQIRVVPRARQPGVESGPEGTLTVRVTEPAERGRANAAVVVALADYFQVPKRAIGIVRGQSGRRKIVEVHECKR